MTSKWSQQEWFPDLLNLLIAKPNDIPLLWNLLKLPHIKNFLTSLDAEPSQKDKIFEMSNITSKYA